MNPYVRPLVCQWVGWLIGWSVYSRSVINSWKGGKLDFHATNRELNDVLFLRKKLLGWQGMPNMNVRRLHPTQWKTVRSKVRYYCTDSANQTTLTSMMNAVWTELHFYFSSLLVENWRKNIQLLICFRLLNVMRQGFCGILYELSSS